MISCSTIKNIKVIHYFWNIKGYTSRGVAPIDDDDKPVSRQKEIVPTMSVSKLKAKFENRIDVCKYSYVNCKERVINQLRLQ